MTFAFGINQTLNGLTPLAQSSNRAGGGISHNHATKWSLFKRSVVFPNRSACKGLRTKPDALTMLEQLRILDENKPVNIAKLHSSSDSNQCQLRQVLGRMPAAGLV